MAGNDTRDRFLCSELVTARWEDVFGRKCEEVVNLEQIWRSGAELLFSRPVRAGTPLRFAAGRASFSGKVTRCTADFLGYLVELEFTAGCEWSRKEYEPEHFFDPRSLLPREELKQKNTRLLEDCAKRLPQPVR